MNPVDIRIFLHQNNEVMQLNSENEWLTALLSGEATKEKKKNPPKTNRIVSNSQRIAIKGK